MSTLIIIVESIVIIAGLLAAVGAVFYALAWVALAAVQFFPMVGKRHRHARWDEMNAKAISSRRSELNR